MNLGVVLLVTKDPQVQTALSRTPACADATILTVHEAGETMRIICKQWQQLDLAVVDFNDGCHGMTLLTAVQTCRPEVPLVALVAASGDVYHASALAYANGATACLTKPISVADLEIVFRELTEVHLQTETV